MGLAKKEREERRKKEREEREEKQKQAVKKEIPSDDVKDNDRPKKKLVPMKAKPKESLTKVRKSEPKAESSDVVAKARKVMPSKPLVHKSSTPPPSKLKKDEKSVVEKVSKAIASGEIDDSRVVKEDEEDRESIVEKDQIEEMETSPINQHEKDFVKVGDDDEDAELQRIKDEEEGEDNQERVPDIGPSEEKKEADDSPPRELNLEKAAPKVAYSHVKTPDEVDDLPEHEVVNPDESMLEEIKSEMSYDLEEKIAKDESEKEVDNAKKDKSEGSIEALKENEEVEVEVEQKLVHKQPEEEDRKTCSEAKEAADEDEKVICDKKEEKEGKDDKGIYKLKKDLETEKGQEERNQDTEGKQESIETIGEIADQEVATSTPDGKQDEDKEKQKEKATDSFVNIVAEAEGRQEPTEQEVTKEDSKEKRAADSFVNDVTEAEGRQEPTEQESKEEDSKEEKVADSFVN